ncbi:MAG: phosphatase PAP2 family protein [Thermodesulfobacteriota bacterium]
MAELPRLASMARAIKVHAVTRNEQIWFALFVLAVSLTLAAARWTYFPGDVSATRFVQWFTPQSTDWAQWISSTAKFPWILILLAVTVGLSWKLGGWRAALLAVGSFAGMWVLGRHLGPLIARPRPSPDLVRVAEKLSGYSFPSIFALNYASTVGFLAVLFARKSTGTLRAWGIPVCSVLLTVGLTARVALAAHWTSDVALSYLIGLLWAALLICFL